MGKLDVGFHTHRLHLELPKLEKASLIRRCHFAIRTESSVLVEITDMMIGEIDCNWRVLDDLLEVSEPEKVKKLTTNRPFWTVRRYTDLETLCLNELAAARLLLTIPTDLPNLKNLYFDELTEWVEAGHSRDRMLKRLAKFGKLIQKGLPKLQVKRRSNASPGVLFDLPEIPESDLNEPVLNL